MPTAPDFSFFGLGTLAKIAAGIWAGAEILSFVALVIAGAVFAFSGENPQRRENAMAWMRNAAIAVVALSGLALIVAFLMALGSALK